MGGRDDTRLRQERVRRPKEGDMARALVTTAEKGGGRSLKVLIRLDPRTHGVECSPHKLYVKRGDRVTWECEGRPFTLDFGWDSPLDEVGYRAPEGGRIVVSIPRDAPEGLYPYVVALFDRVSGLVYAYDPDMIVRH